MLKKILIFLITLVLFLYAFNNYSLENFDLNKISRSNLACLSLVNQPC